MPSISDMFAVPVFLWQVFYMAFSSAIPLLFVLWLLKITLKAIKSLAHTAVR